MLFIIAGLSMAIGYLLEKKFGYVTKLLNTKFGQAYLSSHKTIMFTEMLILLVLAALINVMNISVVVFDITIGLVAGQLVLVMLTANASKKR